MSDKTLARLLETFSSSNLPQGSAAQDEWLMRAVNTAYGLGYTQAKQAVVGANPAQAVTWPAEDAGFASWPCAMPADYYFGLRIWELVSGAVAPAADTTVLLGNPTLQGFANQYRDRLHHPTGLRMLVLIDSPSAMRTRIIATSKRVNTQVEMRLYNASKVAFGPVVSFVLPKGGEKQTDLYFDRA